MTDYLRTTAESSPDRNYRYLLTRTWADAAPRMVVIGLNPSTADEDADDPTIRRCVRLAQREGCGALLMVNLFAYRCTDPAGLDAVQDPVGSGNDARIIAAVADGVPVVAAWGAGGHRHDRGAVVTALLRDLGVQASCLGRTAGGHPRHPLYLPGNTPLQPLDEEHP